MLPAVMRSVVLNSPVVARRRFVAEVGNICGPSNIRVCYLPGPDEGLTRLDEGVQGRTWTHSATPTGRLTRQGKGTLLTFSTAEYLTTPDAADLSFGNGTVDTAFGMFAVANVTNTAAGRAMISKYVTAGLVEWQFIVGAADQLTTILAGNAVLPLAFGTAAITQGQLKTFASVYTAATGGATAANDITHYENAVAQAMTAVNDVSYVAMSDTAQVVAIGAASGGAQPMTGQMGVVVLAAGLTSAKVVQLHELTRAYFRMA